MSWFVANGREMESLGLAAHPGSADHSNNKNVRFTDPRRICLIQTQPMGLFHVFAIIHLPP